MISSASDVIIELDFKKSYQFQLSCYLLKCSKSFWSTCKIYQTLMAAAMVITYNFFSKTSIIQHSYKNHTNLFNLHLNIKISTFHHKQKANCLWFPSNHFFSRELRSTSYHWQFFSQRVLLCNVHIKIIPIYSTYLNNHQKQKANCLWFPSNQFLFQRN